MMQIQLPDQMTAVVLDSYSGAGALRVEQRPIPKPGKNQVLVKVAAASINPSDLAFLDGNYGFRKPTPVVPGFEGSGTVVAAGEGMMGRYLIGKRVACISQSKGDGMWAEYALTSASLALPLDASVSLEQGAMSVVNPLTAIALVSLAKEGRHTAIINTAAASALGRMIDRLGKREGLLVINIVRRIAQVDLLKQEGAHIVLNSGDLDFERQFEQAIRQYLPRLAFDAVGGQTTLRVLNAMPPHARVTVYGGLAQLPVQVAPGNLIFEDKTIDGFWLSRWLGQKNFLQKWMIWRRAQKLLGGDLSSEIRAQVPLSQAVEAVKAYQAQMSGGKFMIRPAA